MHFRVYLFLSFGLWCGVPIVAQIPSLDVPDELAYQIESYIENIGAESVDFDYNTLFETLDQYTRRPLNLNTATTEELIDLHLLSDFQIKNLLDYRVQNGELLAIYELQAIPEFDLPTIYRILPFVTVGKDLDDLNESFAAVLKKSQKNLFLRWGRNLEVPQGFCAKDSETAPAYRGDINRYYLRYAQTYENRISFGLTAEKDPGETFFRGDNRQGFDFMSAHFFYKKVNRRIERIVLGDFRAQFGQGLILNTGFAPGKNIFVNDTRRTGPALNRFTSVNEQNFLRGAGVTLQLNKKVQWTTFLSNRKRDGNFTAADTTDNDVDIQNFTSLQLSGLHRTEGEIAAKNSLGQFSVGSSLQWKDRKGKLGLNVLYNRFDQTIGRRQRPYNQFYFNDRQLLNVSADYTYFYKNLTFFGETAWSDNQRLASINGVTATLHPKVSLSILYRHFPRDFHSLFGQTFSETTGTINEKGLYLGLDVRPSYNWRIALYADSWQHPWLRFRADAPSRGQEYFGRITYYKRRDMEVHIQCKFERKQESYRLDYSKLDELLYKSKTNFRFQLNKKVTQRLELRSRIEWSVFDVETSRQSDGLIFYNGAFRPQSDTRKTGFLVFQDLIFKPTNIPFSVTTRFAVFDIDNYDARIYAYENDVTYQFSVPAYYNKGTRFYANLKYRARRHLTLEARFAQTYWANQDGFSSGNNRVDGPTRSEVKVQVRWRF
ncbi:MAG: helix-hairpin-helix domain-containing protein [Bacteroidota bacterium]